MPRLPLPHLHLTSHQQASAAGVGLLVLVAGAAWFSSRTPAPTAEEMEQKRRERLARTGRITDGNLVDPSVVDAGDVDDAMPVDDRLVFRYSVAGVRYEAVQDVSAVRDLLKGLRVDLPVQVRYDHHNPADSIVVAEEWSGLRVQVESA